jgi:HAD superfamily hydrolase (TIGR01457 family)
MISQMELFLFDLDGTLYLGDTPYEFTLELLDVLRERGRKYLFMTNNSSRSVEDYIKKLAGMGIKATREDFITSLQATAYYLKEHHLDERLYVCGTASLRRELEGAGFTVTEQLDEVECIVMGFDTELTFQKLHDVCFLLQTRPGLPYVATNPDLVCPTPFGSVPDCGSICIGIRNATGREPVFIGKPSPLMPELGMKRLGVSKEETCVVGDRIYTDIKSGLNAGITGILVMNGETTPEILAESVDKPHVVLQNAGEILKILADL